MASKHGNEILKEVAKETLATCERGIFTAPDGQTYTFIDEQKAAIEGTRLWNPSELDDLLDLPDDRLNHGPPAEIEVTMESTQAAAYRLYVEEKSRSVCALNFASARNPGGGFIRGTKAQEEDIARCSGLYPTLLTCPEYYERNRANNSALYSDHMIYSPDVPFFRVKSRTFCDRPYFASIITAPAPNASRLRQAGVEDEAMIEPTFRRRVGKVLALAAARHQQDLVLGAWGCGVFGNDPEMAADAFATWLEESRSKFGFRKVVFAIYAKKRTDPNFVAFQRRFATYPA